MWGKTDSKTGRHRVKEKEKQYVSTSKRRHVRKYNLKLTVTHKRVGRPQPLMAPHCSLKSSQNHSLYTLTP